MEPCRATCFARDALGIRREGRQILVPSLRHLPVLHAKKLLCQIRILSSILAQLREPLLTQLLAALADAVAEKWPGGAEPYVVCTGGEPLLQLDEAAIAALQRARNRDCFFDLRRRSTETTKP
jgi:hypothetical protein